MKRKKDSLPALLKKEQAVPKAVATLIRALDAKRTFAQNGKLVSEEDSATQVKAAVALLTWAEGPPVAKAPPIPNAKLGPDEVKILLRERLVAALCAPGARLGDLVQAERALAVAEKSEPMTPYSEEQAIAEARRIHGFPPEPADKRATLAQDTPSDARPPSHP